MSAKNPVGYKATAVVADDSEETLKRVGGSQSDDWNHVLGNQAIQSLWVKQSDNEVRQRQYNAVDGRRRAYPHQALEDRTGLAPPIRASFHIVTSLARARSVGEVDPGCMKTPKSRKRAE